MWKSHNHMRTSQSAFIQMQQTSATNEMCCLVGNSECKHARYSEMSIVHIDALFIEVQLDNKTHTPEAFI